MSNRKRELRDAALAYLLEHGFANLSLRPMAAELGTSARILLFHFKSKEGLLQEVMEELNTRLQASFIELSGPDEQGTPPLKRFWLWATTRKNLPYMRLLYETQIVAAQNPKQYGRYLKKASGEWQGIAFRALSETLRSETVATLCIAVFDGLILELINTGDRSRLIRALDHFVAMKRAR